MWRSTCGVTSFCPSEAQHSAAVRACRATILLTALRLSGPEPWVLAKSGESGVPPCSAISRITVYLRTEVEI